MRTIEQMISQEVLVCLSSLVSTLAQANYCEDDSHELASMKDQAMELASPVLDYEEAAREAGWHFNKEHKTFFKKVRGHTVGYDHTQIFENDWIGLCCRENIEPHEREVFGHWAITDWFADKLEAAGEKVDKDFAGMCVWARTTTGQAIYADAVIKRIYADCAKSVEG